MQHNNTTPKEELLNPKDHLFAAIQANSKGNHQDAIKLLSKGIELNPTDVEKAVLYNNRSGVNEHLKNFEQAASDLSEAIKYAVNDAMKAMLLTRRGAIFEKISKFNQTLSDYTLAISLTTNTDLKANLHHNRGIVLEQISKPDQAFEDYTTAISLATNNNLKAVIHNSRGFILQDKGKFDEAIQEYTLAIRLSKDRKAKAYYFDNRGNAYKKQGKDLHRALYSFSQAIDLSDAKKDSKDISRSYVNRAKTYKLLGNFIQARNDLLEAEKIQPGTLLKINLFKQKTPPPSPSSEGIKSLCQNTS